MTGFTIKIPCLYTKRLDIPTANGDTPEYYFYAYPDAEKNSIVWKHWGGYVRATDIVVVAKHIQPDESYYDFSCYAFRMEAEQELSFKEIIGWSRTCFDGKALGFILFSYFRNQS